MEKCIVFTDTLISLLTTLHGSACKQQDCGRPLQYRKCYVGTCLVVSWVCQSGHVGGRWAAQPSCNKIRAGNLTLASALLLSGNSYTKVGIMFNFCNLHIFHQHCSISTSSCTSSQQSMSTGNNTSSKFGKINKGKILFLSGDGRNASPGHSAQYCTYSLADMEDTSILQLNVVDVREAAGKSNNMERVGFERGGWICCSHHQWLSKRWLLMVTLKLQL